MKSLVTLALALLVAAFAVAAEEKKEEEAKFDASKMLGDWVYDSGMRAGEKSEKDKLKGTVTIKKDEILVPTEKDGHFTMGYKIDAKAKPATIDIEIKDGPHKGAKAEGIVAVKDKEVTLCYVMVTDKGEKRPTKFESTKDNQAFLFVLKPKK